MTLEVNKINVRYGAVSALHEADITVKNGEVVALIGANGAGKSSLLKALMALVPHAVEQMTLKGVDLRRLDTQARIEAGFALSPEGRHVFPNMTVLENLTLGFLRGSAEERNRRAERMFSLFPRLAERKLQAAGTMSGGEQQMLAIARAMMSGPKILMLDEPTLGLAPIIVQQISAFIAEIRREGIAVIIAEQNAEVALACADRAYVLENGEIVLAGDAAQLSHDPAVQKAFLGI